MQVRKSKKKIADIQPWYMVWVLYILNLFARQAQVAHVPPRLPAAPPKSPDKKKKKVETSTHRKVTDVSLTRTHKSKSTGALEEVPSIPLQKFSAGFEKEAVRAQQSKSKNKSDETLSKPKMKTTTPEAVVSVAKYSAITPPRSPKDNWKYAKKTIYDTVDQIRDPLPEAILEAPVNQLIDNLSFLYRYHLLLISMRVVIRRGFDGGELEKARIILMHNTDAHLFKGKEIPETKEALAILQLDELSEVLSGSTKIDGFSITDSMQELPLYKFMQKLKEKPEPDPKEREQWIINDAIPLLNLLFHIHENTKNDQHKLACNHAIKMLVIIMGDDRDKKVGRFDDDTPFTVTNDGTYESFFTDCKKLRNFYAHRVPTGRSAWVDEQLIELCKAARSINEARAENTDDIAKLLSPSSVKAHYQKEVREMKRSRK